MTVSSPIFLFFFLPVALAVYYLLREKHRKVALAAIFISYYGIAGIVNPFSLLLICLFIFLLFAFTRMISVAKNQKIRSAFLIFSIAFIVIGTIVLRYCGEIFGTINGLKFTVGATVRSLLSISCLIDVYRRDVKAPGIADCVSYLMFFPIMVVGPIVKFKDFVGIAEKREVSMHNFALGARLYMRGFVKRFALGAVLNSAFEGVFGAELDDVSVFMVLAMLVIVSLMMYAILSGYSDMGTGIALMFGIKLPVNFRDPLFSATLDIYFKRFMKTLFDYVDDYIISPIAGNNIKSNRGFGATILAFFMIAVWYRENPRFLLIVFPIVVVAAGLYTLGVGEKVKKSKILSVFLGMVTFVVVSCFWMALRIKDPFSLMEYSINIALYGVNYGNVMLLRSVSWIKYAVTLIFALLIAVPSYISHSLVRRGGDSKKRAAEKVSFAGTVIIMILFVFTVVYYMPQYPQYAVTALDGLI